MKKEKKINFILCKEKITKSKINNDEIMKSLGNMLSEEKLKEINESLAKISKKTNITIWYEEEDISSSISLSEELESINSVINDSDKNYLFRINDNRSINDLKEEASYLVCFIENRYFKEESYQIESWRLFNNIDILRTFVAENDIRYIFDLNDDIYNSACDEYKSLLEEKNKHRLRTVRFDGDILITDPCYVLKERDESKKPKWEDYMSYASVFDYPDYDGQISKMFKEESKKYDKAYDEWNDLNPDDSDISKGCEHMENLGFEREFLVSDTIYGDWSCVVVDTDENKVIGEFCADSGTVCVFHMDDVRKYNPDFDTETFKHCFTIIKDFHGDVCFIETENRKEIYVLGKGNINFKTKQVGL